MNLLRRSISTEALTTLLSTFTLLYKHLLVSSTDPEQLALTWKSVRETLPKCPPEIQRAMAEVWGALLRRLKTSGREQAVTLAAADVVGAEDAIAWVFVCACKSVSQTLHTAVPTIITPLVDSYITCPGEVEESTYTLLRRVLTALIHHVKNAAGFAPIGDFLCQKAAAISQSNGETLRRIIEVLGVACSVRHGSRMTGTNATIRSDLLFENPP